MKNTSKVLLAVIGLLLPPILQAQSYTTAMGLRMGTNFGISLQQKILPKATLQGLVSTNGDGSRTTVTLLIQSHQPLISKRFNFFIGGGIHHRWLVLADADSGIRRGVTAIAGAEMTLGRLNLSWDYKPAYHLNTKQSSFDSETAISLRYVFIKRQKTKRKKGQGIFTSKKKIKERERRRKKRQREKRRKVRLKDRA